MRARRVYTFGVCGVAGRRESWRARARRTANGSAFFAAGAAPQARAGSRRVLPSVSTRVTAQAFAGDTDAAAAGASSTALRA